MPDPGALAGQVAVVTGAGRGIGAAIARGYAAAGATVVCAARTVAEIAATADEIMRAGGTAFPVATDVCDADAVERLYAATVAWAGGLDIVVVNAGDSLDQQTVELSDPVAWQRTIEVNLFGAYHCVRLALPHLKARGGGKIVAVGSGLGHSSLHAISAYSCSKAALWMLVRALADEVRKDGIAVNELIPGPVHTQLGTQGPPPANSVANLPGEWVKTPDDVVPLALFLATQPFTGPTGQSFSLMRRTF